MPTRFPQSLSAMTREALETYADLFYLQDAPESEAAARAAESHGLSPAYFQKFVLRSPVGQIGLREALRTLVTSRASTFEYSG